MDRQSRSGLNASRDFGGAISSVQKDIPDIAPMAQRRTTRLRVLGAEDNPINRLILTSLLEPFEIELTLADDGRQAVAAFESGEFDVVLMDVQMPDMNGVEATTAIRRFELAQDRTPTPILALSANVMSHQVQEYLDAGMNGFIAKPIEAGQLFAALEGVRNRRAPADDRAA